MPNEGKIKASILLILLIWIAAGYSNVNESFTNYGPLNMLFHFFRYLLESVFQKTFIKKFMKKLSFFSSNFKNPFHDVVYYKKIRIFNFVRLKWRPIEYTVKSWKICPFLRLFFQISKMLTSWIFCEWNISVMISHFS